MAMCLSSVCQVVRIRSETMSEKDEGSYITAEDIVICHSPNDEVPGDGGSRSCRLESLCSMSGGGEGGEGADQGEQRRDV